MNTKQKMEDTQMKLQEGIQESVKNYINSQGITEISGLTVTDEIIEEIAWRVMERGDFTGFLLNRIKEEVGK